VQVFRGLVAVEFADAEEEQAGKRHGSRKQMSEGNANDEATEPGAHEALASRSPGAPARIAASCGTANDLARGSTAQRAFAWLRVLASIAALWKAGKL
jgi:hypothetical protein